MKRLPQQQQEMRQFWQQQQQQGRSLNVLLRVLLLVALGGKVPLHTHAISYAVPWHRLMCPAPSFCSSGTNLNRKSSSSSKSPILAFVSAQRLRLREPRGGEKSSTLLEDTKGKMKKTLESLNKQFLAIGAMQLT